MKTFWRISTPMNTLLMAVCCCMVVTVQSAQAQEVTQKRVSLEVRGGANYATQKLGDATLATGYGFEGVIGYKFLDYLGLYGGWSWNHFASNQSFEGSALDFEETGYTFGLQLLYPFPNSIIGYMLKGGAVYNHIETENAIGTMVNDTGHGWGWQVGTGITIALGNNFQLIPEVRYRSLARNITLGNTSTGVGLNYFSGSIGLMFSF
jgi:hypothetical protein